MNYSHESNVVNSDFPKAIVKDIVLQEINNELFIYHLKTDQAFCLNETSALVFNLSTGTNSIKQIKETIENLINKSFPEEIIWLALEQLADNNLLEDGNKFINKANSISRRRIIKKIGLSTMVALPLISSVVVPTAVQAGSCSISPLGILNLGALANLTVGAVSPYSCNSNSDCCPVQGCSLINGNACASVTIGNGITIPNVDVDICVGIGVLC